MSLHRLSAGAGLRYLLRDTASADVARPASTGLSEYYATSGNPPGRWYGAGLAGAGGDGIPVGSVVSEAALTAVFGGLDPVTGQVLGLAGAGPGSVARAVAGFDLTFTVPKSVSVVWALGDRQVQSAVESAHHAAIGDVLSVIEARALWTRTGHGGVHRLATHGAVATGFDHWDSRAHDPNLHTHLVIANRVQGVDGAWRAIDARDLHAGAVAFSELYDAALADHLHHELGVSFAWRDRGPRRAPAFEVDGIGEDLIVLFSTRAASIDAAAADLLTAFEATHRRQPDRVETIRLRQQATLATRPVKTHRPLEALRADWAERAQRPERITNGLLPFPRNAHARADSNAMGSSDVAGDLPAALAGPSPAELARVVVAGVAERRSTWTTWNLTAEAIRVLKTSRCPDLRSRLAGIDELVAAAQAQCVALHDDETAGAAPGRVRWTSRAVLDAEAHLVSGTTDRSAPTAPVQRDDPAGLSGDQIGALVMAAGSGRRLDVLLGPAGSGKTALLRALADVWRRAHGTTSVIGLAPSASAAATLAGSLDIACENTAKWMHESRSRPPATVDRPLATDWTMRAGQLVIVDEASLGYAATVHRVQGTTSDTCHVLTGPGMAREHLYVALTRGRTANHVYVSTDTSADLEPHQVGQASRATGRDVLHRILATSSAELSATEHRDLSTDAGPETPWHCPALDFPSPAVAPPDRPDLGL